MNVFDQIGDYLEGRLTADEQTAFEAELARNPELAEEVQLEKETLILLELHKQTAYKQEMQNLDVQLQQARSTRRRRLWWGYGIVAAGILLALGIWGLWPSSDLYMQAFAPYPDRLTSRSQASTALNSAMEAYNTGDYRQAIQRLEAAQTAYPDISLYLGISHLAANNYEQALTIFQAIPPTSLYYPPAQWYTALTYGQMGEAAKAKSLLESISQDSNHAYQEQAESLLAEIE